MYKNCFSFPLKSESLIADYVREYYKELNTKNIYAEGLTLPSSILTVVNSELIGCGLPKISSGMAFKRRHDYVPLYNMTHIDYASYSGHKVKTSLVIPIDGCNDTYMYWYGGDFSTSVVYPTIEFPSTYPYMKISWNTPGVLVEQVEISKGPMLCRVDVPHSATSRKDGSYRLVMTLRFEENLSIEEIMARRNSMISNQID
jgi:hypothetical protein